jgi:glutaredoxin
MINATTLRSLALCLTLVWGGSQALSWWQDQRFAKAIRLGSQQHEVVLYSTDSCPYCAKARIWLNEHSVRWQDCDVEHDAICGHAYQLEGSPGVPLVRVGSLWSLGFSPAWVASAISKLSAQSPSTDNAPRP